MEKPGGMKRECITAVLSGAKSSKDTGILSVEATRSKQLVNRAQR